MTRLMVHNGGFSGGAKGAAGQLISIPAGKILDLGDLAFTPPSP